MQPLDPRHRAVVEGAQGDHHEVGTRGGCKMNTEKRGEHLIQGCETCGGRRMDFIAMW